MNYPFHQPKVTYKMSFITTYRNIDTFRNFFPEDNICFSTHEINSSTIDSEPGDLWCIEVFFEKKPNNQFINKKLKLYAQEHKLEFNSEIKIETIEDKDWVKEYQEQLKPIVIGNFFITSSSINAICDKDKIPIFIEASRAFGTGDHATTSLCIESMSSIRNHNIKTVFDIGTGSGILSFVAEKIWPKAKILACDIEEVSVNIAKDNLPHNNSFISFYQNSEDSLLIPNGWNNSFDLIISNILLSPLISLSKTIKSLTNPNSIVILSGFLDYQLDSLSEVYTQNGFEIKDILQKDRWISLILKLKKY